MSIALCFTYMKNTSDAEDCTEDVFVKVFTGNFLFEDETHERKWLTVTAINHCKDKLKHWSQRSKLYRRISGNIGGRTGRSLRSVGIRTETACKV